MKKIKRAQRGSALTLIVVMTVLMGWSVSQPIPQQPSALPPQSAPAGLAEPMQSQQTLEDGSDFIDPLRFPPRSPVRRLVHGPQPAAPSSKTQEEPAVIVGRAIRLDPLGPLHIPPAGRIEFLITLTNLERRDWQVIGELYISKGDGRTERLFGPRAIRMGPAQRLRLPVGFAANPARFPPGPTQLIAVLKDRAGQVIDRAVLTITIEPKH
ncbi:MAG: hypothetical protein NZ930_02015 [Candidatus Bipolaricaulota bacterium]|nr:hypothetical protein [Candidatus Bipolaricaulota bacterium]MDW8030931.1 hypothetical protein [Candidatus Bipolaricaulota bacterium]